jgi:hypothetical protein
MLNTANTFYGQQEGERILYLVRPHHLALIQNLVKVYGATSIVLAMFLLLEFQISGKWGPLTFVGLLLAVIVMVIGSYIARTGYQRNKTYITDRRIIRFEPTNLFATNTRSLTWDEVVKVKTYPLNFLLKQLAIGNVVVHARTTIRPIEEEKPSVVTVDDIEMKNVYYYRDLGNYIDKILFTYKRKPKEIDLIKPFIAKPRGQRD